MLKWLQIGGVFRFALLIVDEVSALASAVVSASTWRIKARSRSAANTARVGRLPGRAPSS